MKYILIIAIAITALSCKSTEKYDFTNVEMTSAGAIHNPGVKIYKGGPIVVEPVKTDTIKVDIE